MSELANNNPEKQKPTPLYDDCGECEQRYQLTNENSAAYHYGKQSECDFMLCVCPHCSGRTRIFIGPETLAEARNNDITVLETEDYADQNIYLTWCGLMGIELPKSYELTNRHEAIIRKFGETLLNIPDDLLMDGFESDHEKPYPQKWI